MSSDAGARPDPTTPAGEQGQSDEEFTVALPNSTVTQPLPSHEQTQEPPPAPPGPGAGGLSPYAAQPVWADTSGGASAGSASAAGFAGARTRDEAVDPLPGQVGVALFWITVGWWLFFLVRVLGYFVRFGGDSTILIRTIDLGAEETILAAVLSVAAALLLLLGRGSRGRSPLGYASAALAVATVAVMVWRLVP
jgi:hypothetical protein